MIPIYTRFLSPADYGILELLDLTLLVFSTIFGVQLSSALFYFVSRDAPEDRHHTFSTAILGSIIFGVLAAAIGCLNSSWISKMVLGSVEYKFAFQLYFCSLASSLFAESCLNQLRADLRVARFNTILISRALLQAALNVLFLSVFRLGYFSILWSIIISSTVTAFYLAFGFYRANPITLKLDLLWRMLRYSWPLGIGSLGMLFIHYGDRFFLQRHVSLTEVGTYALAYKLAMLSSNVHGPFSLYWNVEMFNIVKRPDGDAAYVRIFTYLVLVMAAAGLLISIFSRPAVAVFSPPAYHGATKFVPWLALAYVVRSLGDHIRSVFYLEARMWINTRVTAVGFVACLLGYAVLIPMFGVWGAVLATLAAFALSGVYGLFEAQRIHYFHFEYRRIAIIVICSTIIALPPMLMPSYGFWVDSAIATLAALLFPVLLYSSGVFNKDELDTVRAAIDRARASVNARA